jgi:pyruvate dehydrogenase E1 component alpha subunit
MFIDTHNPLTDPMVQIMDSEGVLDEKKRPAELTDEVVKSLYEKIIFVRMANERALKMQRQGRMGTYASIEGEEAAQIGSEFAIKPTDWIVPAFREHAAMWAHGVPMDLIFQYWRGSENGSCHPEGVKVLPVSIPVGSQMLHAVGISWASKMRKENDIALTYFGDGATSEGDFHEAMNFAGVYKTPTIFICQNNQYAISTPAKIQTASKTIAQKALAYGFPGIIVDGNDLFAMYAVTKEAVERARKGEGPTLIEAYTYRLGDHTTSDDATKYRAKEEVEAWRPKDPMRRLQLYLSSKKMWDEKYEAALKEKFTKEIDEMVARVEAATDPTLEELFAYTYAEMTQAQTKELAAMKDYLSRKKP